MAFAETVGGAFPILAAALKLVLAIAVLRAGRSALFNVLFFALYTLSALKSLAEGVFGFMFYTPEVFNATDWFPGATWWLALTYVCLPVMLALYVWFASVFPRPHNVFARHPSALAALFVPPTALLVILLASVFAPEAVPLTGEQLGYVFNIVAIPFTVYALFVLFQATRQAKDDIERHRTKLVLWAFAIVSVPSWTLNVMQLMGSGYQIEFLLFVAPPVEVVESAVIGYAILKYQLLGVELVAKATLKQSVTVGTLSMVFFVTKETLNSLLGDIFSVRTGYLIGAILGGILFLPIEKGSRKLMNKLFPGVNDTEDYLRKRKLDIYKEQLAVAMADGQLKDKELKMLALLRQTLGLTEKDVKKIEQAASPFLSGVLKATPATEPAK